MKTTGKHGESTASYGWHPDSPDHRDLDIDHEQIKSVLSKVAFKAAAKEVLPAKVDLRKWASPVVNQGSLNSCTAHATASMLEYMQNRVHGTDTILSRLFIYKVSRSLLGWQGDKGAMLRTAMGSLRLIGAAPDKYWPYEETAVDTEPNPFCYSLAASYKIAKHFRLDNPSRPLAHTLAAIKRLVAKGLPVAFGYTVYAFANISSEFNGGQILFPTKTDIVTGHHAMAVFGYDDTMEIANTTTGGVTTKGALLCKNSRGADWGDKGYAWLPYEYVLQGMASDWWAMMSIEWANLTSYTD